MTPEQEARAEIDRLLLAAGWHVCDCKQADIHTACGVAIREFELVAGHGTADCLRDVDGRAAGVIRAKKRGTTLIGVGCEAARYARDVQAMLPAWQRPSCLPHESAGAAT